MTVPYVPSVSPASAPTTGTLLFYGDLAGTTAPATALAGIKEFNNLPDLKGKKYSTTRVDQANTDATIDVFEHQAPAKRVEVGDLKFKLGFKKATITTIYGLFQVPKAWMIQFSEGSSLAFNGFINEIGPAVKAGDEVEIDVTVAVDGGAFFTAAA